MLGTVKMPAKRSTEPTRRQRWLPYVRKLADIMTLKDWRIDIDEAQPNQRDAIMSVWICEGRRYATFYFSDRHFDSGPAEQRHSVTHELAHCVLGPYVKAVEMKTDDDKTLNMLMEYSVDALADAIAPLLPLPDRSLSA